LRFRPLQRFPARSSGMIWPGLHSRPPAPSGAHNLLAPSSAPSLPALFHAGSALGVTLQSFPPLAQPYAVPSAVPLLAFSTPSGSCSTRESANRLSGLDYNRPRSSPGPFPLQGSRSTYAGPAFAGPPLLWLTLVRKRPGCLHFRVSHVGSLAGLSRDCRPSWGLRPRDSSCPFEPRRDS